MAYGSDRAAGPQLPRKQVFYELNRAWSCNEFQPAWPQFCPHNSRPGREWWLQPDPARCRALQSPSNNSLSQDRFTGGLKGLSVSLTPFGAIYAQLSTKALPLPLPTSPFQLALQMYPALCFVPGSHPNECWCSLCISNLACCFAGLWLECSVCLAALHSRWTTYFSIPYSSTFSRVISTDDSLTILAICCCWNARVSFWFFFFPGKICVKCESSHGVFVRYDALTRIWGKPKFQLPDSDECRQSLHGLTLHSAAQPKIGQLGILQEEAYPSPCVAGELGNMGKLLKKENLFRYLSHKTAQT